MDNSVFDIFLSIWFLVTGLLIIFWIIGNSIRDKPRVINGTNAIPWAERKGPAVLLIIIAVAGSGVAQVLITQHFNSQNQQTEQINLAKGYLMDIEFVNATINGYFVLLPDPTKPWDSNNNPPQIFDSPLYQNWGLYYSNRQDISKFPPKLSNELYYFYNSILEADSIRLEYNNLNAVYPIYNNSPLEPQIQKRTRLGNSLYSEYWRIITELHTTTIPNIKKDLNDTINSS